MTTNDKSITVSDYMRQPNVVQRFADVLGGDKNAMPYIQSVLILVTNDDKLKDCTPQSVAKSALRAASLGLSCDPALKQAWIISYNRNIGTRQEPVWIKEAQFQPHYKGLHTLAMRTGKYQIINVSPVYEGQRVMEDPLTGLHAVLDNGFLGQPQSYNLAYSVDVTTRRKKEKQVIGWLGYFRTIKGFQKSVWMSSVEIEDHARKYVRDYEKNPNWSDSDKRPVMEMKTVLRQLLSWADLSGTENAKLAAALQEDAGEIIDAPAEDVPPEPELKAEARDMTYEEAAQTIVKIFGGERFMSELTIDQLNKVYTESLLPNAIEAAKVILKHEGYEPPEAEKKSSQQLQTELGF